MGVKNMLFVVTARWKPENMADFIRIGTEEMPKPPPKGTKYLGTYMLLGRCQMVSIVDAPDLKTQQRHLLSKSRPHTRLWSDLPLFLA
jgi:hypothetical protein